MTETEEGRRVSPAFFVRGPAELVRGAGPAGGPSAELSRGPCAYMRLSGMASFISTSGTWTFMSIGASGGRTGGR